jgi:hypothetical protein
LLEDDRELINVNSVGFEKGGVLMGGIRFCGDDDGFFIEASPIL